MVFRPIQVAVRAISTVLALLAATPVFAACPNNPYTLQNGQTADANQVMANFNNLLTCLNSLLTQANQNANTIFAGPTSGSASAPAFRPLQANDIAFGINNIASAATTDLGTASSTLVTVTGTSGITSFGATAPAGTIKIVMFSDALTLSNSASLALIGHVNYTTANGDVLTFYSSGSGNWVQTAANKYSSVAYQKIILSSYSNASTSLPMTVNYTLVPGGGGGGGGGGSSGAGGGGGGSTALLVNGSVVACVTGGAGGHNGNGSTGNVVTGTVTIPAGSTVAVYVGGGGGGGYADGGGGGSGYYGGGGGGTASGGGGGSTTGGSAGGSGGATAGVSLAGGNGNSGGGSGGSGAMGGAAGTSAFPADGGGGGYGGTGGSAAFFDDAHAAGVGTAGAAGTGGYGIGGVMKSGSYYLISAQGGQGGVAILSYSAPSSVL